MFSPSCIRSILLSVAFMITTCYGASLPTTVNILVPNNDTVILSNGSSNLLFRYGLNETRSDFQTYGYAASKFFSLQYPNGTVSDGDGEYYPCSDSPGTTLAEVFTIQKKADMAGLYTLTLNVTYTLPVSGGNCTTGPFVSQTEIVPVTFTVQQGNEEHNGTFTSVTKTYTSAPTGSVKESPALARIPRTMIQLSTFLFVAFGAFLAL